MRRVLIGAGALVLVWAVAGLVTDPEGDLVGVLVFGLAVLVLHDAVLLPLVLAAGALIDRTVPDRWRATVRVAAVVDLAVLAVGLPLVVNPGVPPGSPVGVVRSYPMGLLLILVAVTVTVAACRKGIERSRGRRRRRARG